jgi:hypothetical protein
MCGHDDPSSASALRAQVADPGERNMVTSVATEPGAANGDVTPTSTSTLETIREYLTILADFKELCLRYTAEKGDDNAQIPESDPEHGDDADSEDGSDADVDFGDKYDNFFPITFEHTDEAIDSDNPDGETRGDINRGDEDRNDDQLYQIDVR